MNRTPKIVKVNTIPEEISDAKESRLSEWETWESTAENIRPKGWWALTLPYALSLDGWDDWHTVAKDNFPIRYYFQRTVPCWWGRIFYRNTTDLKYWFLHRFHPKHRYNIIKLKLKPGYYDADTQMIQACFDILVDYVDFQNTDGHVDWESEYHCEEWKQLNELYDWWKARDTREERYEKEHPYPEHPEEWGMLGFLKEKNKDHPIRKEISKHHDLYNKQEQKWDEEDEEMLIKLIKIRPLLWD